MSDLVVRDPLASEIRREAQAQGLEAEDIVEAAFRQYRFEAQRRKINAESEWWRSVSAEVRQQYAGQHVAVHQQSVVDHDSDEQALRARIRARYGKVAVLITPAEGRPEFRIVSTRLARL